MIKNIKISRLHLVLLPVMGLAIMFSGCEGPEGPAGADGTAGTDGLPGQDINESCKVCHNAGEELTGRRAQYAVSGHATGGLAVPRNSGSCSRCHTSQGFIELVQDSTNTAPYATPNQPNCRTCHDLHNTYTEADWARRVTTPPISIQANDGVTTLGDFGGGNLCATCHQARYREIPALTATANFDITSSSFDAHYGPQANILDGSAGYQVAGSVDYTEHAHFSTPDACVGCHMAEGGRDLVGGHTWKMWEDPDDADEDGDLGDLHDTGCLVACHTGDDMEDKLDAYMVTVDSLIVVLGGHLADYISPIDGRVTTGMVIDNTGAEPDTTYPRPSSSSPLTVAPEIAGAIYNYRVLAREEGGFAVHNPTLVKALLTNSIEALTQ